MNLDEFIEKLSSCRNEHGNESTLEFHDISTGKTMKLVNQSYYKPGIETATYNCGCIMGAIINLEDAE